MRINGLPPDSAPTYVTTLFRDLGFEVSPASVRPQKLADMVTASTDVRLKDPAAAKRFCAELETAKTSASRYPDLEAFPVPDPALLSPTSRRVSCKKIRISWHKPTVPAWLNFGNAGIATRVSDRFNKGTYQVCGLAVSAGPPKQSFPRGWHGHNPVPWTVKLKDIPCTAARKDIENAICLPQDKPRHIELAKSGGYSDPQAIPVFVESLLTRIGAVQFVMNPQSQGKRFKAMAHFLKDADAMAAVESLHDKSHDFLNSGKLTVQLANSAKFKISTNVHDALEERLSAPQRAWNEQHLRFSVYRNTDLLRHFTVLKIEGEREEDVANAAKILDEILSGDTLWDGDAPVWSEALASNGAMRQKLDQIQREHGVVVDSNKAKKQLTFFGPREKYHALQQIIAELVRTESTAVRAIRLEPDELLWTFKGGLQQIRTALGDGVASLDILSEPRRIIITGSPQQYQTALEIVRRKWSEAGATNTTNGDRDYTICWTEAENPIRTRCNHCYCFQCFEDLCVSEGSQQKEFTIRCQGEGGKCGKVFSLQELQEHLSSAAFESVLAASFASHIQRRPQHFRYCPTSDCGHIYRTSATAKAHMCANCFKVVCGACHERHGAMICAEYKGHKSGGYEALERYKKEKGIKDCPKCETPMEKTEGCNHMVCGGCRVHLCWVCLKTFGEEKPCYDHMIAVHGNIGLDHLRIN